MAEESDSSGQPAAQGTPQQLTPEQQAALQEKLKNMSPEELAALQKQQCIFCQIISGKIPSQKILEDEHSIAILDINPAAKGHVLIIPKEHYAIMPQVPDEVMPVLFQNAKRLSQVMLKALNITGTTLFIANGPAAGQKAQHFMIHLIPRKEGDGIIEFEEKVLDDDERKKASIAIEKKFNEIMDIKKKIVEVEKKKGKEEEPTKTAPTHPLSEEADEESQQEPEEHKVIIEDQKETEKEDESEEEKEKIVEGEFTEEKKSVKKKTKKKGKEKPTKTSPGHPAPKEGEGEEEEDENDRESEGKEGDEDEDVSLDDIADLFK